MQQRREEMRTRSLHPPRGGIRDNQHLAPLSALRTGRMYEQHRHFTTSRRVLQTRSVFEVNASICLYSDRIFGWLNLLVSLPIHSSNGGRRYRRDARRKTKRETRQELNLSCWSRLSATANSFVAKSPLKRNVCITGEC